MSEIQEQNFNISSITNNPINLENDMGISPQKFASSDGLNYNKFDSLNPANYNFDYGETYSKKKEVKSLFNPSMYGGNVYGKKVDSDYIDKDRYDLGMYRNFEKSTERQYIAPIDEKSSDNVTIGKMIANRNHIDNIRSEVNKKDNYKGRIISGKSINDSRGLQATVNKNKVYRDYQNSPDKYFISNTISKPEIRSENIMKFTNRSIFNNNFMTNVKTYISDPENVPAMQLSNRQQLFSNDNRNVIANNTSQNFYDYNNLGYTVYPNERETITENIERNNATTYIKKSTLGYDSSGPKYLDKPQAKQIINQSELLNPKTYVNNEISRDNLCTYQTDPTKEIISTGREPTLSNVKLMGGVDRFTTETKKLDDDYMTQYQTGLTNIFEYTPISSDTKNTRDKVVLDNKKLSDRISPDLLDPFRNNPLTKPLTSYAYS
uniref:Uncharacterized protein n=1 Tax=viral metagenome TaxID=1070528 RepID=A0A6C0D082_9ZZZZ